MLDARIYPDEGAMDALTNNAAKGNSLPESSQPFFPFAGARDMEQAQRIHHHQKGRELVSDGGDHWANAPRGGPNDSRGIEEAGEQKNFLPGGPHRPPADTEKFRKGVKQVGQIDDGGCFRRYVACAG